MSNETSGPRPTDAQGQFAVQGMAQRGEETTLMVCVPSREDAITTAGEQGVFPTSVSDVFTAGEGPLWVREPGSPAGRESGMKKLLPNTS